MRNADGQSGVLKSRGSIAILLAVVFLVLTAPVIISGRGGPSEAKDQDRHHVIVIEDMISQWPGVDIVDYASATSPGYHLALASINRGVSGSTLNKPLLRWANALFSLGLLLAVFLFASRHANARLSAVLCAPFLLSPYFLGAAIFLTTDNAALLFVSIALGGAVFCPRRVRTELGLGLAATCAIGIRQIQVWVAAPIGFAGLLASPLAGSIPLLRSISGPEPLRWRHLISGTIAFLAPLALLAYFVSIWGGLMPPAYAHIHNTGANAATPAFALALVGAFGVFFAPLWALSWRRLVTCRFVWAAAAIGLIAAVVVPTSYTPPRIDFMPPRAFGALWRVVGMTPDVAERSVLLAALACLGGAIVVWVARSAFENGNRRAITVLLLAMLGWMLAQSLNSMAWQRYFEPMILIFLIWSTALGMRETPEGSRLRFAPLALLALGQAALSAASLYREVIEAGVPG